MFFKLSKKIGAEINILTSIFDALGLSIFCRKMENAHFVSEEMDDKFF